MTCCLAAKCSGGVVIASDALLSLGETQLYAQGIKAREYGSLRVLYAGSLAEIDRLFSEAPHPDSEDFTDLQQLQHRIWNMKKQFRGESYEFLAVDEDAEIHILSGAGDVVSGYPAACIGSEFGWLALDLTASTDKPGAVKARLLKALRAVARRDRTVDGPFFAELV